MPTVCAWVPENDPLYRRYHDEEWGVPAHDDRTLFEFVVLESAQAGLSWKTVLHKREGYRRAFAGFDPERVAAFGDADVERLMGDAGIVRNAAKIRATITNAQRFLAVASEHGTFARYAWTFVGGAPVDGRRASVRELPAVTPESEALARDLKARGFKFMGPTVCYAHMQATGLVNDHTLDCFRHDEVARLA